MAAVRTHWLALASLPLIMLGGLAPWVTGAGIRVDGSQDEVVLVLGLVAALIVSSRTPSGWARSSSDWTFTKSA